ncbi:MAG: phage GP46 family protein [Deltaproteobacteria bacterium]|jgi:phage gp46-like protein|nr:phage GP46 family protein [Deltaproteobacteria bacterium]
MPDLSLSFNSERFDFDLTLAGDGVNRDLEGDDGLLTAVIISLFTDRRARDDDPLPDERVGVPSDQRGWWGDCIPEEGRRDPIGSRLWLLAREKDMPVVVDRAREYAEEALQWLVRDRHVGELRVEASRVGPGHLGLDVRALPLPGTGERTREWNFFYDYINAQTLKIQAPGV